MDLTITTNSVRVREVTEHGTIDLRIDVTDLTDLQDITEAARDLLDEVVTRLSRGWYTN